MKSRNAQAHSELTSLVISPNRELAQVFSATLPLTRSFHVLAEMKSYPPVQTLDIRLRQLRPDLVFLDLATDLDQAAELIEFIAEADDGLMEKWMDRGTLSEAELRAGLHAAVQKQSFIPLFCISVGSKA